MAQSPRSSKGLQPRQIDTRNRVYLPVEAMKALDVGPGDYVAFVTEGKEVRVVKVTLVVGR